MLRLRPVVSLSSNSSGVSRNRGLILSVLALGVFLSLGWFLRPAHLPDLSHEEREERGGVDAMRWLLAQSHYPYGTALPYDVTQTLKNDWVQLPDESTYQPPNGNSSNKLVNQWEFMGPRGLPTQEGTPRTDSGRVRSLEWRSSTGLRVGSASGGLWESQSGGYVCLTDNVSPFIGAFATDPGNDNRIIIGTGEPTVFTGSGIYYTTDRGASWTNATITGTSPQWFYDLKFAPWNSLEVHAASSTGYLLSTDGGVNWDTKKTGDCFAMVLHPTDPGVLYAAFRGDGLYRSPDSGVTWIPLTTSTYAGSKFYNGDLAICKSQPETLWFLLATNDSNQITTILRTDNDGGYWDDVGLPPGFRTDQADYNEAITVDPNDPELVLVGGVRLARSDDGGGTWTSPYGSHADHHTFVWNDAGTELWEGNDGGVFHSTDRGQNFDSSTNTYPISQFAFLSVCPDDPNVAMGGLQDNGVTRTTDGTSWEEWVPGDGGGVSIDPDLCSTSWHGAGVHDGPKPWLRSRSVDTFGSYTIFDAGIDTNTNWYPYIETAPYRVRTYTHAGGFVYWILDGDTTWHKLNSMVFPDSILGLDVERGESGAIYATLRNTFSKSSGRIQVYKDGVWSDGDAPELPYGRVRAVVPNPTIPGRAYAIMNTVGSSTANLWMTTDWGASYSDISGSLKSFIVQDVVAHPNDPNQIFAATSTGVSWTPNGGTNWFAVNMGMPVDMDVRELELVPTGGTVGEYWLYAATFGRGVWRKLIPAPTPPRPPDVSKSVIIAPPGAAALSIPDASGPSLDSIGATIHVQLLDDVYRPVPGIAPSRITLKAWPETDLVWCPSPPWADGSTDEAGITQFSLPLAAGGYATQLQVCLDGIPLGGLLSPQLINFKVRCVDLDQDLNVGLLDFALFNTYFGANDHRVDYNLDGTVGYGDDVIFETAMNSDVSCPSHPPNVGSTLGVISVAFNQEGTQTGQIAAPGATVNFYVIASKLPPGNGMRGFEFAIPALNDPRIQLRNFYFLPQFTMQDRQVAPGEFRGAIRTSFAPDSTQVPLMRGTIRIVGNVEGFELRPTALSHSSFGTPGAPGWVSGNPSLESHPFALVNSAAINPFPGELWAGLICEALDAATLARTVGSLELGGLNSASGGMNIDLMGLGGGFAKTGTAGVDGAGVIFGNTLPAVNVPDGASLNWSFDDPNGNPLVTLSSTAASGVMTHQPDMSAIGSPTLSLNFTQNDQTVYSQSGFTGSWQCSEGLPAILAALWNGGEMNLFCDWGQSVTLTIGGNDYVGDQLILTSETGGTMAKGLFGEIHLAANDIPPVQIASYAIQRFDQIFRDLQNGYFINSEHSLEIVRPDWNTPASFLLERLDGQPVVLNFPGPDPVAEPDGVVDVLFQGGNTNGELEWTMRNGPAVQLETDFSGVGAGSWTAQGLDGGIQQWQYGGNSTQVATLERWPLRPSMTGTGIHAEWNSPTVVTDPANTPHPAVTELQVDPVQPAQPLPDGSRASIDFSQMHELIFTDQLFSTETPPSSRRVTQLLAPYPNPFNPSTKIRMVLAEEGRVLLQIFDVHGRRVRGLINGPIPAGETSVEWDGRDDGGRSLASGIYFAQMVTDAGKSSVKLALVR